MIGSLTQVLFADLKVIPEALPRVVTQNDEKVLLSARFGDH
jgi:hypothetical protein